MSEIIDIMADNLNYTGSFRTTAMGIMPHTDIGKALELSLGLDIPFWPHLPHISYYEDMYVQASEQDKQQYDYMDRGE